MSLLFYVDRDMRAILHPDVIKLCPSLSTLSEEEVLYVILAFDYNSPYRQFPEHDRKVKAMWQAFNENEHELINSPRILMAAEDYLSLQYSPKIETARVFQQKIDTYQEQLLADDNPKSGKVIGDAIDDLKRRIRAMEQDYEVDMQKQGVVKGKMELSFLEKIQNSKKQYDALKFKTPKL